MSGKRILIVENHIPLADLILEILQRETGWEIVGVAHTFEMATRLMESRPDFVVQDLDLPDVSGMAAICLTLERLPLAKVILLADHDEHHYREAARRQGASGCIRKDLIATDLVPIVREIAGDNLSVR